MVSTLLHTCYFKVTRVFRRKMLDFFLAEVNARDMIHVGALWELVRISRDCSREDIRVLAQRTLKSTSGFQAELKRLRVDYG